MGLDSDLEYLYVLTSISRGLQNLLSYFFHFTFYKEYINVPF